MKSTGPARGLFLAREGRRVGHLVGEAGGNGYYLRARGEAARKQADQLILRLFPAREGRRLFTIRLVAPFHAIFPRARGEGDTDSISLCIVRGFPAREA